MAEIRIVREADRAFWHTLDRHLSETEFDKKVRDGMGYVIVEDGMPLGVLRWNLFWDSIPFLTMLYLEEGHRRKGYGRMLMARWESDMARQGYGMALVSTQVDETAQHFYRKLGYRDCGGLLIDIPGYEQPMEMFLSKKIGG